MLVVGLCLIGVVFLFPTQSVEMHVRSAMPEETLVGRQQRVAYSYTQIFLGIRPEYIYTANVDGSGATLIGSIAVQLAWSPDGSKLVTCSISSPTDIVVRKPDGTNPTNLTNTPGIDERKPSWSVTGKIAYERGGQIWTMNSNGTNQALFSAITQPTPITPAWSPDGSQLAFSSGGEIWLINADGTNERRLTTNTSPFPITAKDPAWSPDSLKIAFARDSTGLSPGLGIYVINVDGTNYTFLTGGNGSAKPSWSSDATKIVFIRRNAGIFSDGVWIMNADGTNPIHTIFADGTFHDAALQPFPALSGPRFDFDGDHKEDIAVYHAGATPTAQSYWDILLSGSNTRRNVQFGSGEDKIVPADYNGDGKTEIAVFRPSNGTWYILLDTTGNYTAVHWGSDGDIPLPGDFDGDHKADLAVYRPSDGVWYILNSSDGSFVGRQFGTATDKPLLMDYDGDGKADLAYLRTVGTDYYWFILQSSNNTAVVPRFGVAGDKAVPADYDGDGKSNIAVYSPNMGQWSILNAAGTGSVEQQWGVIGDVPVLGDFDADGLADLTVFRPSTATWYVARSGGSPIIQQWGVSTDLPVPAAYIP
jgi:Tol biopolymer transport system component